MASAGGYDTPMLYTARHIGMGGTAVGYVRDPSALFHNPAGLAHTQGLTLMGNFSPLFANVQGSPTDQQRGIDSELVFAPNFLLGASYRINDWLVAGLGIFPVASAGATYEYETFGVLLEDKTRLFFLEVTPGVAVSLPENVRLGLSYRVTYVSLERRQGPKAGGNQGLDFELTGINWFSFRAGAQWTPVEGLELGVSYRHRTRTKVDADEGNVFGLAMDRIETNFVLPGRLAFGTRGQVGALGLAMDLEYGLNSQNGREPVTATGAQTGTQSLNNVFDWQDALTLRLGAEYGIPLQGEEGDMHLKTRVGYVFDGTTANPQYPTAFGTPPAVTQVLTLGLGLDWGAISTNVAYAYRFGGTTVTEEDLAGGDSCAFCGAAGDYFIDVHGVYVDLSFELN